jgi:hypothetical protein
MKRSLLNAVAGISLTLLLGGAPPALAGGQDTTMQFSDARNDAPTDVHVQVEIQNPDGSWGSVIVPPITIPPHASATQKRDLIQGVLQGTFGAANVTDVGDTGLKLHLNVDSDVRVTFDPGATGEDPDKVASKDTGTGTTAFVATFNPYDTYGQPAIFTAGIVTDVGELTAQVSAQELNFQTDGPIVCQALFQRLAPRAPQYGAQINYAGDRLEIYFDPAYTITQGGVIFGTTSPSPGCAGEIQAPAQPSPVTPGDLNCDGVVDFRDINPFVLLLTNPGAWQQAYPNCPMLNGDINGDGSVNFRDINPFVGLLTG